MSTLVRKISGVWLLLILAFFNFPSLLSQSFYTRNINTENGLPSNSIQAIFKDSRGYIWIGTEAGLCRYDGTDFRIYTTSDGLPGNRIWSITEDDNGDLWFACYGNGISRFDGIAFQNYSMADGLVNDNVRKVTYSKKNKGLLIGTVFGFSYFKDSVFISFKDTSITKRDLLQVTDFIDCDSTVYLLTYYDNKRFIEFKPYSGTFRYLPENHRFHLRSSFSTRSFITSGNDTIISDWRNGIKIFSSGPARFIDSIGQVFDMAEDMKGNIWLASWNDASIENMKGKGGIYLLKENTAVPYCNKLGISTQKCWCLYYDKNENLLWIGTLDNGIYLFPMTGVDNINAADINPQHPQLHDIMVAHDNSTWIIAGDKLIRTGTDSIILKPAIFQRPYEKYIQKSFSYCLEPGGSFEFYREKIKNGQAGFPNPYLVNGKILPAGSLYNPDLYNELINKKINEFERLFEDNMGNKWIKTNQGIFKIEKSISENFFFFNAMASGNPFFVSSDSSISVILQYELFTYKNKSTELIRLRKNATYSSYCNFFQQKNVFWIYNNTEGVLKYENAKITRFEYLKGKVDLSFTSVTSDKKENLLVSTNSGKVYFFRTNNDSLNLTGTISEKDGIIGNDIRWILVDNSNRLWILTNRGLNMADLRTFYANGSCEITFFNDENGFNNMKSTKAIMGPDGKIFAISESRLTRFDPDELIASSSKICRLIIEKMEVNFNEYKLSALSSTNRWSELPDNKLVLPYDKNTLTFYFHLLQFSEPSKSTFSYKLKGVQENWTNFSADNKAVYTKLKPGKYILRFRSMIKSSPGNLFESEFSFQINPPWYNEWWFIVIVALTMIFFAYIIIRNRFRQIKRNAEIDKKIEVFKLEALKSQMNPHFIFNAFNSIQKYILNQDIKAALNYMSDFAGLIRKTLDNSTKERICLADEISYLKSYIELEKRRVSNLNYTIECQEDIDYEGIFIPPIMIQPVVENSILHGIRHLEGEGMIRISFTVSEETGGLICRVEDNGIGRARSKELYNLQRKSYSSKGSQIIKQRADLCGVKIIITDLNREDSSSGTLTEFRF
jgi:ligand-binding sensor domain-containing protein